VALHCANGTSVKVVCAGKRGRAQGGQWYGISASDVIAMGQWYGISVSVDRVVVLAGIARTVG
jgi:hypothetical protein